MRKVIKNFNPRLFVTAFILLLVLFAICWMFDFQAEEQDAVGIQYTLAQYTSIPFEFPFFWLASYIKAFQTPLFYFPAITADLLCYALLIEQIITFFRLKKKLKARSVEAGMS